MTTAEKKKLSALAQSWQQSRSPAWNGDEQFALRQAAVMLRTLLRSLPTQGKGGGGVRGKARVRKLR